MSTQVSHGGTDRSMSETFEFGKTPTISNRSSFLLEKEPPSSMGTSEERDSRHFTQARLPWWTGGQAISPNTGVSENNLDAPSHQLRVQSSSHSLLFGREGSHANTTPEDLLPTSTAISQQHFAEGLEQISDFSLITNSNSRLSHTPGQSWNLTHSNEELFSLRAEINREITTRFELGIDSGNIAGTHENSQQLNANRNAETQVNISNENFRENISTPQSRLRMGHTATTSEPSAWSAVTSFSEKMGEQSTARVQNIFNRDRDDDDTTIQSTESVSHGSPPLAPMDSVSIPGQHEIAAFPSIVGTPSTVSTAPSTDEASTASNTGERIAARFDHSMGNTIFHRRVPSWETSPMILQQQYSEAVSSQPLPPAYSQQPQNVWNRAGGMQRVASFRSEQQQHGFPPLAPGDSARWQRYVAEPTLPFLQGGSSVDQLTLSQPQGHYPPYQQAHPRPSNPYQPQSTLPAAGTPPRNVPRTPRTLPAGPSPRAAGLPGNVGHSPGGARSPSEVLKTLLRKKACLYEPDTSRAVALVTWLVGRELALEYGFFSRQQLQAGVHAVVSRMIETNVITRTKVNRCMQIILNSCFHYIIPRPDGSEENGELFRYDFAVEVSDDEFLLKLLPTPWNTMTIDRSTILEASSAEAERGVKCDAYDSTPQSSPLLGSIPHEKGSPGKDSLDGDSHDLKRAVLLCFNENVRCAQDVFRCHNEFIRDTAHASNLQLSSSDWRYFFGKEAAGAPYIWGNIGIPVPFVESQGPNRTDALGVMTREELASFRTSWCGKRYDHDHELCGFAHVEVNNGWLRRNPKIYNYKDEMCQSVIKVTGRMGDANGFLINECPKGVACEFAHSFEEITYHPRRYKNHTCTSANRPGGCNLGDVCWRFHPVESYRFPKKVDSRSGRHPRHSSSSVSNKAQGVPPNGAPMLYASPAPVSRFEQHLCLPGLKNLFRRHGSVSRAVLRDRNCICCYNCFGDDSGVAMATPLEAAKRVVGLPSVPRT